MIHTAELFWIACNDCEKRMNGTWGSIEAAERFAAQAGWKIVGTFRPLNHYCPSCADKRREASEEKRLEAITNG